MLKKTDRKEFVEALNTYVEHAELLSEKSSSIKKGIKDKYLLNELYTFKSNKMVSGYCTLTKEVDNDFDMSAYIDRILLLEETKENYLELLDSIVSYAKYANVIQISCSKENYLLKNAINEYFYDAVIFDLGETLEFRCKTLKQFSLETSNSYINVMLQN